MLRWTLFSEMHKEVHCLDLQDSVWYTAYSVESSPKRRLWTFHSNRSGPNFVVPFGPQIYRVSRIVIKSFRLPQLCDDCFHFGCFCMLLRLRSGILWLYEHLQISKFRDEASPC